MSGDILLYIIIGIIVLGIIFYMMNKQSVNTHPDNRDFREYGNEQPRYDDRDIAGRGSFGRDASTSSTPSKKRFKFMDGNRQENRPSVNQEDVTGRGGFGRDKD